MAACGNSQCEFGEQCTDVACATGHQCARDCPPAASSCPVANDLLCSGNGACLGATGVCVCFAGHVGDACEHCGPTSVRGGNLHTCSLLPGEALAVATCTDGILNGFEDLVDCGGSACKSCPSSYVPLHALCDPLAGVGSAMTSFLAARLAHL